MLLLLALGRVNGRLKVRYVIKDCAAACGKVLSARHWTSDLYIMELEYSHLGKSYKGKVIVNASQAKTYAREVPILVSNRNPKRFLLAPRVSDAPERGFQG